MNVHTYSINFHDATLWIQYVCYSEAERKAEEKTRKEEHLDKEPLEGDKLKVTFWKWRNNHKCRSIITFEESVLQRSGKKAEGLTEELEKNNRDFLYEDTKG